MSFKPGRTNSSMSTEVFSPTAINHEWNVSDPQVVTLLEDANRLLGELNAFSQLIPDVDFFIRMHITKEAATSSRIEGTQTSIEEALVKKGDLDPEKRDDWQEVHNYIQAINTAVKQLRHLPLSNRVLRETHAVLLQGVRGKHKQPGEFRTSQNWIGVSLKHAAFVPPHHQQVPDLMSDLEKFIHNDQIHVPHLLKIALIHYQFETIHPFLDGNGRLGRLLIVLYLVSFGLLHKPALYLSDFFERHRGKYEHLMDVRTTHKVGPWVLFFLLGMRETAALSIQVFKDILILKEGIERESMPTFHVRRQPDAQALMRALYQNPMVSIKSVAQLIQAQTNTAAALIDDFVKLGILQEFTGQKRNRLFVFEKYVRLFKR